MRQGRTYSIVYSLFYLLLFILGGQYDILHIIRVVEYDILRNRMPFEYDKLALYRISSNWTTTLSYNKIKINRIIWILPIINYICIRED